MEFLHLSLERSLYYIREALDPFGGRQSAGLRNGEEELFCFDLNPAQACRIDPEQEEYLGSLRGAGRALAPEPALYGPEPDAGSEKKAKPELLELRAGHYYFTQIRGVTADKDLFIETAVELQKEALWERLKMEDRIYLRRLFEDGAALIQLFRPYSFRASTI
jgi:hypothetical protein